MSDEMGFNDVDLDRFLVLLNDRALSPATVRSMVFQFKKLKAENERLKSALNKIALVGSSEMAYTRDFTNIVNGIARSALGGGGSDEQH